MIMRPSSTAALLLVVASLAGCAAPGDDAPRGRAPEASAPRQATRLDPAQAERLRRILPPVIAAMDKPVPLERVKVTVLADDAINAANGGGGDFYVTTGLLRRASDDQLRAIMAHEAAHADLGHVAKTQTLATGVGIGAMILDQVLPGSGAITPLAGQLIVNSYSRGEETEADAHGVTILRRMGRDGKAEMVEALSWLRQQSGDGGGGFFATHPATGDRIEAVQALP